MPKPIIVQNTMCLSCGVAHSCSVNRLGNIYKGYDFYNFLHSNSKTLLYSRYAAVVCLAVFSQGDSKCMSDQDSNVPARETIPPSPIHSQTQSINRVEANLPKLWNWLWARFQKLANWVGSRLRGPWNWLWARFREAVVFIW